MHGGCGADDAHCRPLEVGWRADVIRQEAADMGDQVAQLVPRIARVIGSCADHMSANDASYSGRWACGDRSVSCSSWLGLGVFCLEACRDPIPQFSDNPRWTVEEQ